jgi:hypothetical protein
MSFAWSAMSRSSFVSVPAAVRWNVGMSSSSVCLGSMGSLAPVSLVSV